MATCFHGTQVVIAQGAALGVAAQGGAHRLTVGAVLHRKSMDPTWEITQYIISEKKKRHKYRNMGEDMFRCTDRLSGTI